MTNFELITQNPDILGNFILAIVDDALEAKGCSLELKLLRNLQNRKDGDVYIHWWGWLEMEAKDDKIIMPDGEVIEKCVEG